MQKFPLPGSRRFFNPVWAVLVVVVAIAGVSVRAQTLTVGTEPSAIAVNPVTNTYYVGSSPVAVINGATNAVTTVPGTAVPEQTGFYYAYAVNSVTNKIYYLSGNSDKTLSVIDGATNTASPIALGATTAQAIAVNPVTNKIYVAMVNGSTSISLGVVDGVTNAVTILPLPSSGVYYSVVVNPVTNKIYLGGANTPVVTVVDGVTNAMTNITTPSVPGSLMAVNTATNQIYVGSGPSFVINGATNAVTTLATPAGFDISAFGYNPVTNTLYVGTSLTGASAGDDGTVTVINGSTGATTTVTVGVGPVAIAVDTATDTILVANAGSNTLTEINGVTNATTTLPAGNYPLSIAVNPATNQFYVANEGDGTVTEVISPAGTPVTPPAFTSSPANQSVAAGQSVTFTAAASGSPTYQWLFNNVAISGATNASLTLTNVTTASAGTYTVVATNGGGSVSASVTLAVAANSLPAFTTQPVPQTVVSGTTVVFNSAASGSPAPTFQWKLNGNAISGATSARLVITGATAANAGSYTCVATNSQGSATSTAVTLAFVGTTNVGRLINLSVNTTAGKSQVLTVGFVSGGSGTTGSENLLIRATGPALAAFGVAGTLADPTLAVLSGQTIVASNDNWGTPASNQAAVTAADNATGAFALTNPASLDAALVTSLNAGGYTVQISGNTAASGTTLAEVYDTTTAASYTLSSPRLINVSSNNLIAANSSMTAGFVVGGTTAKTVLIRATGPALAVLGVQGTMPDPQLALHTTVNGQDTVLASNAGWGGDPQITATDTAVGAFTLTNASSKDSVVLVTLPPGAYTAVASSVTGTAGIALIEVYEVP